MHIGLGIDTGGTFTDAVIYDFDRDRVLASAKSPTTHENLQNGISSVLDKLGTTYLPKLKLVSLSTTLATNACVEGRGGRAKLIMIGGHPVVVAKYGKQYGLPDIDDIVLLDGDIDEMGQVCAAPDWDAMMDAVKACDPFVDGYAVVQTWSMRNPILEKRAKQAIARYTDKPVVCGYELSSRLNILRRASGAWLNAKLMPVIESFMQGVLAEFEKRKMTAPVVVVRGDGSVMSLSYALKRPVETLLSGPAASVQGGMRLTDHKNAIVMDIGGTTTDMSILKNGYPNLLEDGAVVGSYQTSTASIDIHTVFAGGDVEVLIDKNRRVRIGQKRVLPICMLASQYAFVADRLQTIDKRKHLHTRPLPVFYRLGKLSTEEQLNAYETRIVNALSEGPLDVSLLCEKTGQSIYSLNTESLEKRGIIQKSGFTPTDMMHIEGVMSKWDAEASKAAASILCRQYELPLHDFLEGVKSATVFAIYQAVVHMLLKKEDPTAKTSDDLSYLLEYATKKRSLLHIDFQTSYVLCGLGAPAWYFTPPVARLLNTQGIVPEYAEVANAIGSVTGKIINFVRASVKPRYEHQMLTGYVVATGDGSHFYKEYDEALEKAKCWLQDLAVAGAQKRGANQIKTDFEVLENRAKIAPQQDPQEEQQAHTKDPQDWLVESTIICRAVGIPAI